MRDLDTAVIDAFDDKSEIDLAVLAELDFESGVQRLWAGPEGHALDYDSNLWYSLADLGQIDKISEAEGLKDSRTTVSLRLNSDTLDQIEVDDSRGREAKLILLVLNPDGTPIGPVEFRKSMGAINVVASQRPRDDSTGELIVDETISLDLLDVTASLERRHIVRMTHETQLRIDDEDYGLEFVKDPSMSDMGLLTDGRRISYPIPFDPSKLPRPGT